MSSQKSIIERLKNKLRLSSIGKHRIISKGKALMPVRADAINYLRRDIRLPSIDHREIMNKGKNLLPAPYRAIGDLGHSIQLPEINTDDLVQKGKDLIDVRSYYENYFYSKISRYSIPSLSMMYANSKFKTSIYKAGDPQPCLDEIFYKYESLIPFGKEYWFAIFTSLDGRKPMQLVATFGRRNSRRSVIDNLEVSGLNAVDGVLTTGAFVWCFDGKKKLFVPPVQTQTVADGTSIVTSGDGLDIAITGTAPEYRVGIKNGAITGDFRLVKPGAGISEEVLNELKMGLNYQVYNLYYNFEGTLNGSEYKGRCYLQKVILSTPMVPWYWCRVVFRDGSFLVFFKPYFGSKEYNYVLRNKGVFYSAKHDRLFWFYNIDVACDSKKSFWRFRSSGDDYALDFSVKSYADHRFNFRSGGVFNYHEFMVNVKKFSFSADGGKVTVSHKDVGPGAGLVEDATGILI
ncbi:MAG: hypothetical protein A4E28_01411 [Methanocella sp. PtaU1.Bin125]|nr:MAG: hypothetical protein A4E28_01411 [Methanocella sp. PtaU1.Bin125]